MDLMSCCLVTTEDGFAHTMPVFPGMSEMVYSYEVGSISGAYTFTRRVYYPTAQYNVFIQGEGVELEVVGLVEQEPIETDDGQFAYLSATDLVPGSILTVRMSNLGRTSVITWVVVALVVLAIGSVVGYVVRRKGAEAVPQAESAGVSRDVLLAELAQLDDDFEDGGIGGDEYRRLRTSKKAQLLGLMQRSGERSSR